MDTRASRERIRREWEEEAIQDAEEERQIEHTFKKWRLAAIVLGFAFGATCAALVPFLAGHAYHSQWDLIGKKILLLAMGLFVPWVFVTTSCLIEWNYLRSIRKIHVKYAPPSIKYKKG
jgi:hypothetical protein